MQKQIEIIDELKDIRKKIQELGSVNATQIESDNAANDRMLSNKQQHKGTLIAEIRSLQNTITDCDRQINSLAAQCKHNNLIRREIEYATAVYNWFRDAYDKQEALASCLLLRLPFVPHIAACVNRGHM